MSEWKETEIGKLPIDAELIELDKCLGLIIDHRGKTPKKLGGDWVDNGVRAISAKNVHGGKLTNKEDIRYVTFDIYKCWMKDDLAKGDCLLASEGATLGEHLYWDYDFPVVLSQRLFCIRTNPLKLDPKYFYAFVTSNYFQNQIHGRASGTSVFGLRQTEVRKMLISLIPLERQKVIGEIHYNLNKKIDLLYRQNATLEKMAEALFMNCFIEDAKEEWGVIKLGKFVKPQKGKNITRDEANHGEFPVVAGGVEPSCYHNKSNTKAPVITISSSGANAGYVRLYHTPVWSSDSSYIDETITPYVYTFYVFLKMNQSIIFDKQEGSAQPHIYPTHIMDLDILDYPEILLTEFEEEVKCYFQKIKINQTQISTLTSLRDTLLPKLMSGEVRVKND